MAVLAAERVLQLLEASDEIGGEDRQEAISLAREDLAEMRALHAYLYQTQYWQDYAAEDTLRSFLGILYLVRLDDQGADLPQVEHIRCLLQFGRELTPESFQTLPEHEDVRQLLEELWHQHCARCRIQVASESFSRPMMRHTDMVPSNPSRPPTSALDLTMRRPCSAHCVIPDEGAEEQIVPMLFDLLKMVWKSEMLRVLPSRVQCNAISKALSFVRQSGYEEVEKSIVSIYSSPFYEDSEYEEEGDEENDWSCDFTAKEATLILKAIYSVSPLFHRLVLERPPKSVMPHWMAWMTCTEHARLWLARVDLNIYYDQGLTYGQLCTQESRKVEKQVLKYSFLAERAPSPLQRKLRLATLDCIWNNKFDLVHNFRSEDFSSEENKLWSGLKKLGHPTELREGMQPDVNADFKPCALSYIELLKYEDKRKVSWLFWELGQPSEEELAQCSGHNVQQSRPTTPGCGIV